MLKDLIREHARLSAQLRALETKIQNERPAALAALPEQFGYPDLPSFIQAVKRAARKPAPARPRAARKRRAAKPQPVAAPATITTTPTPDAPPPAPAAPAPSSGTSLDDPANFGVLPDYAVLDRGSLSAAGYIEALAKALRFAEKVLHTSKVPAAIWRAWRQFSHKVSEAIHAAQQDAAAAQNHED